MKVYKAILHTSKTEDEIRELAKKENWMGDLTQEDINNIVAYNKELDGLEVFLIDNLRNDGYFLMGWDEVNATIDGKIKEAFYLMEQDRYFGNYLNERERFEKVWQAGEYETDAMIGFSKEDVEIIATVCE